MIETPIFQVFRGLINMTVGGFVFNPERMSKYTATSTHATKSSYLAIGVPYSSIERIAMPFTFEVWICLFVTILIIIMLFCFCEHVKSYGISKLMTAQETITLILDIVNSAFGGPLTQKSIRNGSRFAFTIWLLMSFILRNLYSTLNTSASE